MNKLNNCIMLTALFFLISASLEAQIQPAQPFKKDLLVNTISFLAAKEKIGITAKFTNEDLLDFADLPIEFQVAEITGYLLIVDRTDSKFNYLKKFLEKNDYILFYSIKNVNKVYFIPNAFYGSSLDVDAFLDGKAADEIMNYLEEWYEIKVNLDTLINENNKELQDLKIKNISFQKIDKESDKIAIEINQIDKEISEIQNEIQIVNSIIDNPRAYLGYDTVGITNNSQVISQAFKRSPPNKPPYNPQDDFMRSVIQKNCTSIEGKKYDSEQITNKYLHPDLVKALDGLMSDESDMQKLQDIGLGNFRLASAARTPMQQNTIDNPIAAGMFSSGHIFCAAADIAIAGTNYNDAINHNKLRDILSKHGISLPDNLKARDPNHFFLSSFLSDKTFANKLRVKMLGDYYNAMEKARSVQNAVKDKLNGEQKSISNKIKKLDDMMKTAKDKLDSLNKNKDDKNITKKDKQQELNRSKDALAGKLEAERKAKQRKDPKEREKSREQWGQSNVDRPGKDNYWDKYSYREFHGSDGSRECWGREVTRENTRTGDWERERHIECRSNEKNDGFSRELP